MRILNSCVVYKFQTVSPGCPPSQPHAFWLAAIRRDIHPALYVWSCELRWSSTEHGRPQRFFQLEGNVDILLIFFRLLAMQRKWTYTKRKCPMLRQQLQTVFSLWENVTLSKRLF